MLSLIPHLSSKVLLDLLLENLTFSLSTLYSVHKLFSTCPICEAASTPLKENSHPYFHLFFL